ncbi:MAG: hypothetical protein HYT94_00755 [Parcubacteria group bacterium]|nr:hypothetical protein [Parcubacteria group bacterium]
MTSLTRTEAIIEKFPFLKKHIPDFLLQEDETFIVEFLPLSPGIFLSKPRTGGSEPIWISLYSKSGEKVAEVSHHVTVEQQILDLNKSSGNPEVYYIVKSKTPVLQVYVTQPNGILLSIMTEMLRKERRKAKNNLEKTLAGLYKEKNEPTIKIFGG